MKTTYLFETQSGLDIARLITLHHLLSTHLPLLPPQVAEALTSHLATMSEDDDPPRVLDLACGPGLWSLEVAWGWCIVTSRWL